MASDYATLTLKSGEVAKLDPSCFLVFVDETGHELFADINYPVFGLGGCAVLTSSYREYVKNPWEQMKKDHFAGAKRSLHANELHQPLTSQLSALANFFKNNLFCRVAAVITNNTILSQVLKPYQVAAAVLFKRTQEVAQWYQFTKIAVIIEQSDRGDKLAKKYFDGFRMTARSNTGELNIPLQFYLMPKAATEPGLEVADFIMHAAGTQTRERLKDKRNPLRKDFAAVFHSVDKRFVSFLEVTQANWNDA